MALPRPDSLKARKGRYGNGRLPGLTLEKTELFLKRGKRWVKAATTHEEQERIVKAEQPTSGHLGVIKTYKRVADGRFYWKWMVTDVKKLVSKLTVV